MIYEIKNYENDEGKLVIARCAHDCSLENPQGSKIYLGKVTLKTPQGAFPFVFQFPEGTTLETAFETFEDVAQQTIEAMQREQQKQVIVPGSNLILPR